MNGEIMLGGPKGLRIPDMPSEVTLKSPYLESITLNVLKLLAHLKETTRNQQGLEFEVTLSIRKRQK